jgi:hypothetical protein
MIPGHQSAEFDATENSASIADFPSTELSASLADAVAPAKSKANVCVMEDPANLASARRAGPANLASARRADPCVPVPCARKIHHIPTFPKRHAKISVAKLDTQAEASCVGRDFLPAGTPLLEGGELLEGPSGVPLTVLGLAEIYVEPYGYCYVNVTAEPVSLLLGQDLFDDYPGMGIYRNKIQFEDGTIFPCSHWAVPWDPHGLTQAKTLGNVQEYWEDCAEDQEKLQAHMDSGHASFFGGCSSCILARPAPPQPARRSDDYWQELLEWGAPGEHFSCDIFQHNKKTLHPLWVNFYSCVFVDKFSKRSAQVTARRDGSGKDQLDKAGLTQLLKKFCKLHPVKTIEVDQQLDHLPRIKNSLGQTVKITVRGTDQHAVVGERWIQRIRSLWDRNLGLPGIKVQELMLLDSPSKFLDYLCTVLAQTSTRALGGQTPAEVEQDPGPFRAWKTAQVTKARQPSLAKPPPDAGRPCYFFCPRQKRWGVGTVCRVNPEQRTAVVVAASGGNPRLLPWRCVIDDFVGFSTLEPNWAAEDLEVFPWWDYPVDDTPVDLQEAGLLLDEEYLVPKSAKVQALGRGQTALSEDLFAHLGIRSREISPSSPLSPASLWQWYLSCSPGQRAEARSHIETEAKAIQEKCIEVDRPAGGSRAAPSPRVYLTKWTLKIKEGGLKARLCIGQVRKGKTLTSHYASPLHHMVLRTALAMRPTSCTAVKVDFVKAFLQADAISDSEEITYAEIPSLLQRPGELLCWQLIFPIYGMRCAPAAWQTTYARKMLEMGAVKDCLGIWLWSRPGAPGPLTLTTAEVVILIHVDDSLCLAVNKEAHETFMGLYTKTFIVGDQTEFEVGKPTPFLGMTLTQHVDCWEMSPQQTTLEDKEDQRSVRGSLNWLGTVSQPQLAPWAACYEAGMMGKVQKRLQEQVGIKLYPCKSTDVELVVFCDASHGSKARRGMLIFLKDRVSKMGSLIHWSSTGLECAVGSSTTELQALESATGSAARIHGYLVDHGLVVRTHFFSDALVLLAQVKKEQVLAPPFQRYVPTISHRVSGMAAHLSHLAGKDLPSDPQTKVEPSRAALENLYLLMRGNIIDLSTAAECL